MSAHWWILFFAAISCSLVSSLSMFRGDRGQRSNQGYLNPSSSANTSPLFSSDPNSPDDEAYWTPYGSSQEPGTLDRAHCVVTSAQNLGLKLSLLRAVLCIKYPHCDDRIQRLVDVCVEFQCESSCRLSADVDACLDMCIDTSLPQSQPESTGDDDLGVARSKRYRLGLYDCISSYCSALNGDDRKSCIVHYCHRSATAQ
ncbi:hypothetical protein CAPTEDRAFT_202923 [Capitella teleta]|uniref:Uncharacterized protein n=1 Tax=Capitella teleta TaxID=283909 RepID=R7TPT6_CAPTE|nr:hypothetical protein CAPTEDRAFT_202923 [Capitella teleta]|eukprot:ELT95883.1 hypothetical protein CAPTEDRAFT_202923 [Capitella teleta]